MTTLYLDLETYSDTPISHGTHAYAAQAEILLIAYAVDNGPVHVIDYTTEHPDDQEFVRLYEHPDTLLVAHNSAFDRTVLNACGYPSAPEQWRDTMVQALAHSLPGSLGELCQIFRLPTDQAKDKDGRQLVHLFTKPRPARSQLRRATRHTHPQEWARFVEYARLDVAAMRAVHQRLPAWNYQSDELALWHLDQHINDRGVAIDTALVHAALAAVAQAQTQLNAQTQSATGGQVAAASQRDALLNHLQTQHGIALPDLQKATLERHLANPDLPAPVRELLQLRLHTATTSTAKYKTLAKAVSADGRLRGTLQFCGAARTGRWAGRLFQPQNLPRPTLDNPSIDTGIRALKLHAAHLVTDNIMELAASALRGCIIAAPGHKLVVADLSNIEGRVLAWLAGEQWKLQAFRDFDAGAGHDLYKLAYAKAFNVAPDNVNKEQRQIGKVMELALGYEGGVGAFTTFAAGYGIDLDAMAAGADIPAELWAEADRAWHWFKEQKRPTHGLAYETWCTCDAFKRAWRNGHPAIASFWPELEAAALRALQTGQPQTCRRLHLDKHQAWLRIRLPSGRRLCYPAASISEEGKLSYMGIDQYRRQWQRIPTYGGKLAENITQAVARDILARAMPAIEAAGYRIVLTVHDEIIAEAPDQSQYNAEHLAALMATPPAWAAGLPLAAAGFEAQRYRKD